MIDSPKYKVAKLGTLIKPLIPNKCALHFTNYFLLKVNNSNISSDEKLVSFDVLSHSTNIHLNEIINIIVDYVFSDNNTYKPLMDIHIFIKLIHLLVMGCFYVKIVSLCKLMVLPWGRLGQNTLQRYLNTNTKYSGYKVIKYKYKILSRNAGKYKIQIL